MHKRMLVLGAIVALLVSSTVAFAGDGKIFGYVNPAVGTFGNIPVNTETLDWDKAGDIPVRNALGIRPILIADLLFFAPDAGSKETCGPSTMRLREDWQERTDGWLKDYGQYLTTGKIAGIAIDSESNNGCIAPEALQAVARYLISKGIERNLLGTGDGQSKGSEPLLEWIPPELGWVAIFDYDCLDPEDPAYQIILADLKSRLAADQKYLMIPKGFLFFWQIGQISAEQLGESTIRYAKYCVSDPQCGGVLVFLGQTVSYSAADGTGLLGTDQMPAKWPLDSVASRILLESPTSPDLRPTRAIPNLR